MTATKKTETLPRDKIDTRALALFGAMFLGLALVGAGSLWAPVSDVLQPLTQFFVGTQTSAIEIEQRRQADAIRKLERGLIKVGLEQDTMTKLVDHSDSAVSYRFGQIEQGISALESKVKADMVRTDGGDWLETISNLDLLAAHTRTDIHGLRSSLDEHVQAYRKEITAITTRLDAVEQANRSQRLDALVARLDRLEQMVSRDLTSSIRQPVRKRVVKRKPRAVKAARQEAQPAYLQMSHPQYPFPADGSAAIR